MSIKTQYFYNKGFNKFFFREAIKKELPKYIFNQKKIGKPGSSHIITYTVLKKEILKITRTKGINSAAHITGGGLIENLLRSIPDNLSLNIDLSKIKITKIFKWLKTKNISDDEMIKTFNCGVGFCIIVPKNNVHKIKKFFSRQFMPYEIGFISKNKNKINLPTSLKW